MTSNSQSNPVPDKKLDESRATLAFAQRVLVATCVVVSLLVVLIFIWYAADLFMLVFAAVLVSILLRTFTDFVIRKTGMRHGFALILVSLGLVVLIAITAWLVTGRIGTQVAELRLQLPQAVQNVRGYLGQYEWVRNFLDNLPTLNDWLARRGGTVVSQLTGLASTTAGVAVNILIVGILGLYLASQPSLYSRGLKHLLPLSYRERAGEVLRVIDEALRRWLVGRFALMLINGALTAMGLKLLGIPLAMTLGLLAGLLNFVPNFGPWIAAIPAVLIAFLQGPQQALYVAVLYLVLQSVDGYLLTPLVDRKSVELPPVLTITAQVVLGLAFGFIGILLASPLTAVALILIKMLYIEDLLGDRIMTTSEEVTNYESRGKT
jgi:predicted PurR-regulated permease PerM